MMSVKRKTIVLSWFASAGALVILSALGFVILRVQLYSYKLLARNDGERTLNYLLSTLRTERGSLKDGTSLPRKDFLDEMDTMERIIRTDSRLKERISGLGLYDLSGNALYLFGTSPGGFLMDEQEKAQGGPFPPRQYSFDDRTRSLRIVHPLIPRPKGSEPEAKDGFQQFSSVLYIDMLLESYWARRGMAVWIFVFWELLVFSSIVIMRNALVKNIDYRRKLRDQQELVLLGSAARTLAHEIKNPLSAISLKTDIISRLCPKAVDEETSAIHQEIARLRILVDRVGDFLREPRGEPEKVLLCPFVEEVSRRILPGIHPSEDDPAHPVCVFVDRERFYSVLENLLRNAVDSGGDISLILVHVTRSPEGVRLDILDRGSGLAETDPEKLFDPFFTTKSRGFGIGLSIARRFVEAAGGRLRLMNRDGGGTTAQIILPEYRQ